MKKPWPDVWASAESWSWILCCLLKGRPSFFLRHGYEFGTGVLGFAKPSDGLMSKEMIECSWIDNVSVCICCFFGIDLRLAVSMVSQLAARIQARSSCVIRI